VLQGVFQIPARDSLAAGDFPALHRFGAGVIGDVEHRLDGKHHLFRQPEHG